MNPRFKPMPGGGSSLPPPQLVSLRFGMSAPALVQLQEVQEVVDVHAPVREARMRPIVDVRRRPPSREEASDRGTSLPARPRLVAPIG